MLISTGASLPHRVQHWLVRVIGRMVVNGYGTTETGGLLTNGAVNPTSGVEIRLADVPSLGYLTTDKPFPRGEILAKCKNRNQEYFNRCIHGAEMTIGKCKDAIDIGDDDWIMFHGEKYFRTGDLLIV